MRADDALASAWNGLVSQMERPEVFYTYEWALAVHRSHATRFVPLLMLGFEGDRLMAGAALAVDKEQSEQVVFLAATTADYCDFVSAPEERDRWIGAVLGELRRLGVTRLALANVPQHSRSVVSLQRIARKYGFVQYTRPGYFCSQVKFYI